MTHFASVCLVSASFLTFGFSYSESSAQDVVRTRISDGTLEPVSVEETKMALEFSKPSIKLVSRPRKSPLEVATVVYKPAISGSAMVGNLRPSNSVSVSLNRAGTHLATGATNGAIMLWKLDESLKFVKGDPIRLGKDSDIPFFAPGHVKVELYPAAPSVGVLLATGNERKRINEGKFPAARVMFMMSDGGQEFSTQGNPLLKVDGFAEGNYGMSLSQSGSMEAYYDSAWVVVTQKHDVSKENESNSRQRKLWTKEGLRIRELLWSGEDLVILDDKTLRIVDPREKRTLRKVDSVGMHGLAASSGFVLSFQGSDGSLFDRATQTEVLMSFGEEQIEQALIADYEGASEPFVILGFRSGKLAAYSLPDMRRIWSGKLMSPAADMDIASISGNKFRLAVGTKTGFCLLFDLTLTN